MKYKRVPEKLKKFSLGKLVFTLFSLVDFEIGPLDSTVFEKHLFNKKFG